MFVRFLFILFFSFFNCLTAFADGESAPTFSLRDINGKQVSLEDYKGSVVLINFWATWCGPCQTEMPHLQKIYADHKDKGFVVRVAANFDQATLEINKKLPDVAIIDVKLDKGDNDGI